MGLGTFKGGIHPYDGKELTKDKAIREVFPKGDMVYPLTQHIGAPAVPIVAVGDDVLKGQKIAEAGGYISAPIFASASGTVKAIEERRVITGDMVESIVIENDGEFRSVEYIGTEDYTKLTKEEIIQKIREAGIVGMGGAGFPTHVKLSPKEPEKIEYIIANCSECEPYLTSDYRRMLEQPEKLIGGIKIVLQLFDNAIACLGIEDNKPDCIELLTELTKDEPRIEVCPLTTKYPEGSERQLIYAVTKRAINSSMLPADAGCIVNNVDTLVAIYNAVVEGRPLMHRIVTITGDAVADPVNYCVCIGMSFKELLELSGGFKEKPKKIISGGPMMGIAVFDTDIPTIKTSSALLCMTEDEVAKYEPSACINCGRCVNACPSVIIPSRIADFAERNDVKSFEKWHGMECIECGSCSYVCPGKRHLTQVIKAMRRSILADRKKKS